jgi:hypothetical protein
MDDDPCVKRILVIASILVPTALGFGLTALAVGPGGPGDETPGAGGSPSLEAPPVDEADEEPTDASGPLSVHGGTIDRLHAAASCDLVSTGELPGNWTHGDYVTAVAGSGAASLVTEAAHSACGKPVHAAGHGVGPPTHALEHGEKAGLGLRDPSGS